MEKCIEVAGVNHKNSFLLGSHALVNEVAGNLESSLSGSLAVTGLEHIELAVFNGKFHILHISVVLFQSLANLLELSKCLGELLLHLGNLHRCTNAGNDIFALSICKEFTEKTLCACSGVTCERNAGTAIVAHITECHGLNVYGCTPRVGDIVVTTVNICAGVVPAAENSLDSAEELLLRVGGELCAYL